MERETTRAVWGFINMGMPPESLNLDPLDPPFSPPGPTEQTSGRVPLPALRHSSGGPARPWDGGFTSDVWILNEVAVL